MSNIEIDCAFPGGNIIVEDIHGDVVTLRQDRRDTEGFWFYWYFRARGAAGRTLDFRFTDGKTVGVRGPAISLDEGDTWAWASGITDIANSFKYVFPEGADAVRFSFGMPYTQANWDRFIARLGDHPALSRGELCRSRKARQVEMLRAGRLDGDPLARVAVTCRHHCCEMMASYAVEGVIESVLADDDTGRWLRENIEVLVVPFVDKDGVEDGDQGKNRRPRDHNRDYDADSIYPETKAISHLLPDWGDGRLRLTLDLHCPGKSGDWNEHVYQVGRDQPEMWGEQQRFGRVLEASRAGPLPYSAANDLPFGEAWNAGQNYDLGCSFSRWASGLPDVQLATSFEIPYANASGIAVNAATARAFGRDLGRALCLYLEQDI